MHPENKSEKIMLCATVVLALLCAAGIAVGTENDLVIAQALHAPDNVFWRVFTILGMYPFMALWVLYMGVICRQVRSSGISGKKKTAWTVVCGYLGLSTSVVCSWAMFAADTVGGVLPQTINNPPVIAAGALFGVYPLFFVGLFTSKKEYDKRLMKRLIVLCSVMLAALMLMGMLKLGFSRPRYRLLIQDIPGVDFQPWYLPFVGSDELIRELGLDWNNFRSFPSGHVLQSMSLIFVLPPLAEIYGSRGNRNVLLYTAGTVFAVLVGISRMVMGAHFLSDICAGALLAIMFAFADFVLAKKMRS
ncbi:MAG: phosphatase PAP2 family protein [Ruminiclostridium sp.]|nr:phosphatase PAP2 family protein [Ruminiclostridium sp.]